MILILKILLHNVYKIINLRYPTYVYQFLIFLIIITKIECWPVFKQDPRAISSGPLHESTTATGAAGGTEKPLAAPEGGGPASVMAEVADRAAPRRDTKYWGEVTPLL